MKISHQNDSVYAGRLQKSIKAYGRTTPDGPVYDKLRRPPVTAELKSGISAFKMAAGGHLGSDQPNFLCKDGPYGDTSSHQIWLAYLIPL